ncbi:MAG: MFS transporter, partial [Clostridia bacterium]|nr:MFS transporter [Clostridia bacterium]
AALPLSFASVLVFVLAGVFQNIEYPSYDALFADLSATKDRERAYSLEDLGGNIGLVLSPTIAGLLFKNYLWLSFLISGVAIAVSTVIIAALVKDVTPVEDASEEAEYQKTKEGASVFAVLRENPLLLLYVLSAALFYGAYGEYNYIMPLDMAAVHGEAGAVIFGTVASLNCITVVVFTPLITRLFTRMRETGKMVTGRVLVFAGYLVFLLLLGFIPGYYIAMLVFTWGEIFSTVAEGPYVSSRVPASHRGRINGLMSVFGAAITGAVDLTVGRVYDRSGSTPTWVIILAVALASVAGGVVLKARDKKAYPKLYLKPSAPDGSTEA